MMNEVQMDLEFNFNSWKKMRTKQMIYWFLELNYNSK